MKSALVKPMERTLLSELELAAVRKKFRAAVKRREVILLLKAFGCTRNKARTLIEGSDPALKPIAARPGMGREWARESIIEQFNVPFE